MRTYLVFREKSRQWNADKEIQALLKETSVSANGTAKPGRYSRRQAARLLAHHFDTDAILKRKLPYERLDQLTVDILAGVR
jgi:xylose isomerase